MTKILTNAEKVLSFVGAEIDCVDVVWVFMEFPDKNMTTKKLLRVIRNWKYERFWKAIDRIWSEEYWKRVWVV